jgi:hypothetical protein
MTCRLPSAPRLREQGRLGLLQMEAAAAIMRAIEERPARALGEQEYAAFKAALRRVARLQRQGQQHSPGAR